LASVLEMDEGNICFWFLAPRPLFSRYLSVVKPLLVAFQGFPKIYAGSGIILPQTQAKLLLFALG
jgi:hypothetical protein